MIRLLAAFLPTLLSALRSRRDLVLENLALRQQLATCAWAAVRTKDTYLRVQFLRIKSRRGAKKTILEVASSMLVAAFHMLRDGVECRDLGPSHLDRHDKTRTIKRLRDFGCTVEIPQAA